MKSLRSKTLPDTALIFLLLLLAAIFFWKVFAFPDQILYSPLNDTIDFFYPMYNFAHNMIRSGDFPAWNPLVFSGYPLAANPQIALFYPPNVLFFIFPTHLAFGYSHILHMFLGGVFMYLLIRYIGLDKGSCFIAAITFMFSAFLTARFYAGHYSLICAAIWTPLIFLLLEIALNKISPFYALLAGAVLGIQISAGHIQISFLTVMALGLYLLLRGFLIIRTERDYKKTAAFFSMFALVLITGILLSAIELFPLYEFSTYSTRGGGEDYEFATVFSLHPGLLLFLFLSPWETPSWISGELPIHCFWEYSPYVGILPLILMLFAICFRRANKYVFSLSGLAIVSLTLALGRYFPPYWLLYKAVPGFDMFRGPARFMFPFTFSASVLAGFGFNFLQGKLTQKQRSNIWRTVKIFTATVVILMLAVAAISPFHDSIIRFVLKYSIGFSPEEVVSVVDSIYSAAWKTAVVLAVLLVGSILVIALRTKNIVPLQSFNVIAALFILANLWFCHIGFVDTRAIPEVYSVPAFVTYLQNNSQGYRVYDPEDMIPMDYGMIYGIEEVDGYDATMLRHYSEFLYGVFNSKAQLNLLHVKYTLHSQPLNDNRLVLVDQGKGYYLYENPEVLPKAFMVYGAKVITSEFAFRSEPTATATPFVSLGDEDNLPDSTPTPTVVRVYPERKADGSVAEITQWSDGSFASRLASAPPPEISASPPEIIARPKAWGVSRTIAWPPRSTPQVTRVYPERQADGSVAEISQWSDGSFTSRNLRSAPRSEIIKRLNAKDFDPKGYIFLEQSPGNVTLNNGQSLDEVEIRQYSSNEIIMKTESDSPGFLFLSETWYPSWKAYVDGKPSEVYKTDHTLMSVYLSEGNHTVRFVYEDHLLKIGAAMSGATAILIATVAGIHIIKRRRAQE